MIFEQRSYVNDAGEALIAKIPVGSDALPSFHAVFQFQVGEQVANVPCPIPGDTVEQAFAGLPIARINAKGRLDSELRKRSLVVPGAAMNAAPNLRLA